MGLQDDDTGTAPDSSERLLEMIAESVDGLDRKEKRTMLVTRTLLDRYEVRECLGVGGMGRTYLAWDRKLCRKVALKAVELPDYAPLSVRKAQLDEMIERVAREARILARIRHENVVAVHDYYADHDPPFIVMDYVRGRTLAAVLDDEIDGRLPPERAVLIAERSAAALETMHVAGLVHRDVKPGNIMLVDDQAAVKLIDFGLAKVGASDDRSVVDLGGNATLTLNRQIVGTPRYMSPEQARSDPGLDRRSDIYSLGVVLYQMLGGEVPYDGDAYSIISRHADPDLKVKPIPNPGRRIHPAVLQAVYRALEKRPEDRFQTAGEMRQALLSAQGKALAIAPTPAPPPIRSARPRWPYAVVLGLALVGLLSLLAALHYGRRSGAEEAGASTAAAPEPAMVEESEPAPPAPEPERKQAVPMPVAAPDPPASRPTAAEGCELVKYAKFRRGIEALTDVVEAEPRNAQAQRCLCEAYYATRQDDARGVKACQATIDLKGSDIVVKRWRDGMR